MQLVSLTFSSHISKNEWEVKPTPQFDYRRMRTKFYNILWDLGNLKIRGKFCNIFHLKILRILFLNILYLRHPLHFIILPPMGPLSIYTKARALIKQKTFTMKPFIWSYSFYELVRPGVKWKLARLHLQILNSPGFAFDPTSAVTFSNSCFAFHFFAEQI